jgi:tetratricopeptide (TPR) repeat protein
LAQMANAVDETERGRDAYERRAWLDAYTSLSRADEASPLGAEDLELLANSASMVGRMDDYLALLERAHRRYLDAGNALRAARCAGWIGMNLAIRGEIGPARGWFGRAQRLVEREGRDSVEQGWLLLPAALQHEAAGDYEAAYAAAVDAARTGERFGDADLSTIALHVQGLARIKQARVEEGLALLDEAMVAVTAGEVSPVVTGIVYCGVIAGCEEAFEPRRAQEWTEALTHWIEEQPQMVAFTGRCLAHRAGIKQRHGAWRDALEETRLARQRSEQAMNRAATGQALYQQGELHRLQGDFAAAEAAYRDANAYGREPQPGLALLRLGQDDAEAAAAAIRRALGETTEPLHRAGLLPAYAEIMLAVGDVEDAREACRELTEIAGASERAMWARSPRTLRERSSSRRATLRMPSSHCVARGTCGRSSRRRTRLRRRASSSAWPAVPSVMPTTPRWSWRRPATSSSSWEQRRKSPASTRTPRPTSPPTLMG